MSILNIGKNAVKGKNNRRKRMEHSRQENERIHEESGRKGRISRETDEIDILKRDWRIKENLECNGINLIK